MKNYYVALICDTDPLLAAFGRDAPDHQSCAALINGTTDDLIVPGLVLAERDYWCSRLSLRDACRTAWPLDRDLQRARGLEDWYSASSPIEPDLALRRRFSPA